MARLSKANRKLLADMVFSSAEADGIKMNVTGSWVEFSPTDKVTPELLANAMQCGDELAALVKQTTPSGKG